MACKPQNAVIVNGTMRAEVKGDRLIIEIDVSPAALKNAAPSKTGKSHVVASTAGFVAIGPVKLNLNCIR